jgi:hypothetical protein
LALIYGHGAHINLAPWLRVNNELVCEAIANRKTGRGMFDMGGSALKVGCSLLPALRLGRVELFGGPGVNYMTAPGEGIDVLLPKNNLWERRHASGHRKAIFVGWQAGVQFVL